MKRKTGKLNSSSHPKLTEYEEKVFRIFWKRYEPGVWPHDIQLEGDKRLPVVAAGFRLIKKGVLVRWQSCCWQMTELGKEMAEVRQQSPEGR